MSDRKPITKPKSTEDSLAGLNRAMPESNEAEMGILSCLLQDPAGMLDETSLILPSEAFYHFANRTVYELLLQFHAKGLPIDIATLTHALREQGHLEKVGGPAAISELYTFIPVPAHYPFYLKVLKDKHLLRQTIAKCAEVMDGCFRHGETDADQEVLPLITAGEQCLFELVEKGQDGGKKPKTILMPDMLDRWVDRLDHITKMRGRVNGIQTGWVDVDRAFGGLGTDPKGDLVVLAGFPGMGKSVAAASVVEAVGLVQGISGTYFPLEMGVDGAMDRFGLGFAGVDTSKARNGFFAKGDHGLIATATGKMRDAPIQWWEGSFIECTELRATIQIHVRKHGIKWVMIDHMGQIRPSTKAGKGDKVQGQIEIMETLHSIRHDFGITIFLCVQLAKAATEKRPNQPKQLSDLRGASEIGEYATHCIFIDRPIMRKPWHSMTPETQNEWEKITDMYARQIPEHWAKSGEDVPDVAQQNYKEHALLAIAKNRHGATPDHLCVRFNPSIQRFTNRSPTLYSNNKDARQVELHGF